MKDPSATLYFDNPLGMQLIEEVLRKIDAPYEVPTFTSDPPLLMIQIKSGRSSRKVFEACKEYFAIEGPIHSAGFKADGTFSLTPVWEFKLLSIELKPESIPQVAELICQ